MQVAAAETKRVHMAVRVWGALHGGGGFFGNGGGVWMMRLCATAFSRIHHFCG